MTGPESAADKAADLEQAVFQLYDRAVAAGDDVEVAADLMLETFEAEHRLQAFLDENTDALAEHPIWQGYYNNYAVQISHPMTAIACYTIADAFARAAEHIAAHHKKIPDDHLVLVEIHRAGSPDRSIFRTLTTPDRVAGNVHRATDEFLAATALTMARAKTETQEKYGSTRALRESVSDISRVREILGHMPAEALIARWAVAETSRSDPATPNPWDAHMEKAGLDLRDIQGLAGLRGLIEIGREPRHPVAYERVHAIDQLITHYLEHPLGADEPAAAFADHKITAQPEQAQGIQHLIDSAHRHQSEPSTESAGAPSIPEYDANSAATEPEVEM